MITGSGWQDFTRDLAAAYEAGASYAELRERFEIGDCMIRNMLRLAGVTPRHHIPVVRGTRTRNQTKVARAMTLRAEGKTLAEIGREVGRHPDTVRGWFREVEA